MPSLHFETKKVFGISGGGRGAEHSLRMESSSLHLVSSREIERKGVFYLFDIRVEQTNFAKGNLGQWDRLCKKRREESKDRRAK